MVVMCAFVSRCKSEDLLQEPDTGRRALARTASAAAPPGKRPNPLADQPSQGRAASERAESGQGGPELTQDGRRSGRVLEHPPVAGPVEGDRLGAGPRGGLGRRGRAQEGILAGDDYQSGGWDGREIRAPVLSDVHGRTVEVEDAISHGAVDVRCQVK